MIVITKPSTLAVMILLATASCSGGGGTATVAAPAAINGAPCGPIQELHGRRAAWMFHQCGSTDNIYITPETLDSQNGAPLGQREMGNVKLSFRYTWLENGNFIVKDTFGAFFQAYGENNAEVNWQWMSYSAGGGAILSRLIIQRFDGTCAPHKFCEQSYITDEIQFIDASDVWQWDCQWNTGDKYIICDITKPSDPKFKTVRAWNQTLGQYYGLIYLGVGSAAFKGAYPSYDGTVSDFKMTVFE